MNDVPKEKLTSLYEEYLERHKRNQNKGAFGKDSEKLKTYKSEWVFQHKFKNIKQFNTIKEAQDRCDQITKSPLWKKLRDEKGREVRSLAIKSKARNTGKRTAGWASGFTITLDMVVGLDEYTLIHEMAHCLGNWHHGRSFRRDLLKLVSRFMGREAASILKSEFKKNKLACGEPRAPLTYEKWFAARLRAEHMLANSGAPLKKEQVA
jgi:hypothetical protein